MSFALMQRLVVPGLLIAGLCIIALGQMWNHIVPSSAYWGPEQAEAYIAAHAKLHSITDDHGGHSHGARSDTSEHEDHEQELAAAREAFNRMTRQLEDARESQGWAGRVITATGIGIVLVGMMLHFANRPGD